MADLQLGSSSGPAKNFHGVDIGPLSKILAVKIIMSPLSYNSQHGMFRPYLKDVLALNRLWTPYDKCSTLANKRKCV